MLLRDGFVLDYSEATPSSLVVFLHIAKTAGMSIRRLLFDSYGVNQVTELLCMSTRFTGDIDLFSSRALCGHFHANSHIYDQITVPFVHFTVLRDPVERVLSEYYFYRERPEHIKLHGLSNRYTLEELFEQENRDFFPIFNWMSFYLSGLHCENPPIMLDAAKYMLEFDMTFFGFTNNLPELVSIGQHLLGWPAVELLHINPTIHKETPSPYLVSLIKQYNQLDIKLYEFAYSYYNTNKEFWLGRKELDAEQRKERLTGRSKRIVE